jgi:hypothetical protein
MKLAEAFRSLSPAAVASLARVGIALGLLEEMLQRRVHDFLAWATQPFVPDHPLVIEDEQRWRASQIPLLRNGGTLRSIAVVRERAPTQLLLVHHLFEFFRVVTVGVDADEGEGLVFQNLDERPLVGP